MLGRMSDPVLLLHASCLLSRHGFRDGDIPDDLWEWLGETAGLWDGEAFWHTTLCHLVETRLVPLLVPAVTTFRIVTSHNPVRAETVGGRPVDDIDDDELIGIEFSPQFVEISFSEVLKSIQESKCAT
jgi:hypothetical protein